MNGKRAKACRRVARATCDATKTKMMGRGYKVPALLGRNFKGEVIMGDSKPIVTMPEHMRYTMFWPRDSYRRSLRETKTGKGCAWINERS